MIDVALLYPCDPLGPLIGGIESFIKGVISTAPDTVQYSVIGATTDISKRPVGQWTDCQLGGKTFRYFPLMAVASRGKRSRIPATVSYELAALIRMPDLSFADIIESHRIEHLLIHARSKPFNLFVHQNMAVLKDSKADIGWKAAPGLYNFLERQLFNRPGSISCVRADAVEAYQANFPQHKDKFVFQPTWMDETIFYPLVGGGREDLRSALCEEYGFDSGLPVSVAVGRVDSQKDPLLMVETYRQLASDGNPLQLLWIGDGVMRDEVEQAINKAGLNQSFLIAGLKEAREIANILRACDFFAMSSAYEGMPIAVLEALACGCPVASTNVGEVPRLVEHGVNGYLARPGERDTMVTAVQAAAKNFLQLRGEPCTSVAEQYQPKQVLLGLYRRYQQLCNLSIN